MMRLKVYDILITGKKYKWLDEEIKGGYVNDYNELCYIDKYGNFHIACELNEKIEFEVEN